MAYLRPFGPQSPAVLYFLYIFSWYWFKRAKTPMCSWSLTLTISLTPRKVLIQTKERITLLCSKDHTLCCCLLLWQEIRHFAGYIQVLWLINWGKLTGKHIFTTCIPTPYMLCTRIILNVGKFQNVEIHCLGRNWYSRIIRLVACYHYVAWVGHPRRLPGLTTKLVKKTTFLRLLSRQHHEGCLRPQRPLFCVCTV